MTDSFRKAAEQSIMPGPGSASANMAFPQLRRKFHLAEIHPACRIELSRFFEKKRRKKLLVFWGMGVGGSKPNANHLAGSC
jgi:hypothetical protein